MFPYTANYHYLNKNLNNFLKQLKARFQKQSEGDKPDEEKQKVDLSTEWDEELAMIAYVLSYHKVSFKSPSSTLDTNSHLIRK
jgi:hypothetical protein